MKESYIYHTLDDGDDISIEETPGYHLFNEAMIWQCKAFWMSNYRMPWYGDEAITELSLTKWWVNVVLWTHPRNDVMIYHILCISMRDSLNDHQINGAQVLQ